jgi:hypothetical protein
VPGLQPETELAVKKRPADAVYARVTEAGTFEPSDQTSRDILRRKKLRRGDEVRLVVMKPRNKGQWRKAHELGTFIANHLEPFERFQMENGRTDSHGALKHLQFLSGIECEEAEVELPDGRKVLARMPITLAFDEMDEGRFQAAYGGFCQYLINTWWSGMDEDEIASAASLVGLAA